MLSIIIPTIDRPKYLITYIKLLKIQNFSGELIIGDSSNQKNFNLLSNYISNASLKFKVVHKNFPQKKIIYCLKKLTRYINYNYCCWLGDDDYLCLDSVKKCILFLNKNKSYSGAGGVCLETFYNFNLNQKSDIIIHPTKSIEDENPISRLNNIMTDYKVLYSIKRTEQFKKQIKIATKLEKYDISNFVPEVIPIFVQCFQGKIKYLNIFYMLRLQTNIRNIGINPRLRHLHKNFVNLKNLTKKYLLDELNIDKKKDQDKIIKLVNFFFKFKKNSHESDKFNFFIKLKKFFIKFKIESIYNFFKNVYFYIYSKKYYYKLINLKKKNNIFNKNFNKIHSFLLNKNNFL